MTGSETALMAHTPFLCVVPQRHSTDCSCACLAMLLGVSYEDALLALRAPHVVTRGVMVRQVLAAARRLGHPLRFCRTFDLDSDTGILGVKSPQWPTEHLVVLKDGLIVDTDATIWDVDVFLSAYDAKPTSLLTL